MAIFARRCTPFKPEVQLQVAFHSCLIFFRSARLCLVPLGCTDYWWEQCDKRIEHAWTFESIQLRRGGCCSWGVGVCVCCLRKQFKKIFEIRMNITSAGIVKRNNIVLLVFNLSSIQYFRIIIRTKWTVLHASHCTWRLIFG